MHHNYSTAPAGTISAKQTHTPFASPHAFFLWCGCYLACVGALALCSVVDVSDGDRFCFVASWLYLVCCIEENNGMRLLFVVGLLLPDENAFGQRERTHVLQQKGRSQTRRCWPTVDAKSPFNHQQLL